MTDRVREARVLLRKLQDDLGHRITPRMSVSLGQQWEHSLRIDPDGHGLADLIQAWREILTPMVR